LVDTGTNAVEGTRGDHPQKLQRSGGSQPKDESRGKVCRAFPPKSKSPIKNGEPTLKVKNQEGNTKNWGELGGSLPVRGSPKEGPTDES